MGRRGGTHENIDRGGFCICVQSVLTEAPPSIQGSDSSLGPPLGFAALVSLTLSGYSCVSRVAVQREGELTFPPLSLARS